MTARIDRSNKKMQLSKGRNTREEKDPKLKRRLKNYICKD